MSIFNRLALVLQRIDSEDVALEYIRESCNIFLLLAVLSGIVGVLGEPTSFIDAGIYAALAFWLRATNSAIPAVLMLLLTGLLLAASFLEGGASGRGIVIRAITVILATRAIEATVRLPKLRAAGTVPVEGGGPVAAAPRASAGKVKIYG